eukprot:11015228-Lingulodinium_polyedra.AAC.1
MRNARPPTLQNHGGTKPHAAWPGPRATLPPTGLCARHRLARRRPSGPAGSRWTTPLLLMPGSARRGAPSTM